MLELINRDRAAAGLAGLAVDDQVTAIAAGWSREMAAEDRLSHNDDYLSAESMNRLDATAVGENVAFADSLERIHEMLMDSPPHRANILSADFRQIGVAAVRTPAGDLYLTEDFLTRRAARPAEPQPPPRERRAAQSRPAKPAQPRQAAARNPRPRVAAPAAVSVPLGATTPIAPPASSTPPRPPAQAPPTTSETTAPADPPPTAGTTAPAKSPMPGLEAVAESPPAAPETMAPAGAAGSATAGTAGSTPTPRSEPGPSAGDVLKGASALFFLSRWFGRRA